MLSSTVVYGSRVGITPLVACKVHKGQKNTIFIDPSHSVLLTPEEGGHTTLSGLFTDITK